MIVTRCVEPEGKSPDTDSTRETKDHTYTFTLRGEWERVSNEMDG